MKHYQSANRKLIFTIVALIVALLALFGALVGVIAAKNIGIGSSYKISYTVGDNIATKVRFSYTTDGTTYEYPKVFNANFEYYNQIEGYVTLNTTAQDSGEITDSASVQADTITLSSENATVTFLFEIENILEIENGGLKASLICGEENEQFSYQYWLKGGSGNNTNAGSETDGEGFRKVTKEQLYEVDYGSTSIAFKVCVTPTDLTNDLDTYVDFNLDLRNFANA